jgi:hypothetical protein
MEWKSSTGNLPRRFGKKSWLTNNLLDQI